MGRFLGALAALALLASGCGKRIEKDESVPLDKVPPAAIKAAHDRLPDVNFETAWKVKGEAGDAYEIRGKTKVGKIRDVQVTDKGEVLEVD
jgi:hypothetical protein